MLGWLKSRVKKESDDDFSDLRSGILGEPAQPFNQPAPPLPQMPQEQENFGRGYDDFTQKTRDVFEPIQTPSLPVPEFSSERQPAREYELMDRLNLIESQIAAVRSMTETINERLKNMEARLGVQRRY